MAGVKSTSRADGVFARLEADRAGADDAIYPTLDDHLTEGTTANLFIVRGDEVVTPPLGGIGQVSVDVRHGVGRHADLVVAQVGVERRVQDALLGDLPGDDHAADAV